MTRTRSKHAISTMNTRRLTWFNFNFLCLPFLVLALCDGGDGGLKNKEFYQLQLPSVVGPESIAFDCHGKGPYVGVSDGRVLKWQGEQLGWSEFAVTSINRKREVCDGSTDPRQEPNCGRPLGLKFNPMTCDLYIADAYFGLLVVGPAGGTATQLANSAQGVPFMLTNALDIDTETGAVYFTDSSVLFQRRDYFLALIGGDKTGRLLKFDPQSKSVTVLLEGLAFPNGVALSKDNSFILVAETGALKLLRVRIRGTVPQNGDPEVFAELERYPDNIKRNDNGDFWVALNSARGRLQELQTYTGSVDHTKLMPWFAEDPVAVKYDEEGRILKVLNGNGGNTLDSVSEVEEFDGVLYIGSVVKPYVGVIKG